MRYKIPGSDDDVFIDERFVIPAFTKGVRRILPNKYELKILGKTVVKHEQWLYCAAVIGYLDEFDRDHMTVTFSPYSKSKFPYIIAYDTPKYYNDEFRYVPGIPHIATDCNGNVLNILSNTLLVKRRDSNGYEHVSINNRYSQRRMRISVHRLVAMAWLEGRSPLRNCVNHINGKEKANNATSNLEWVSYHENTQHALRTGLMPFAHKGKIRDVFTGEIMEFPSLESMNDFLGMHQKEIRHFLTRRRNHIYCGRYEVRIDGDKRPWIYGTDTLNHEPSRYIYHIEENGKKFTINGIRKLIKYFKCWNMESTSNKKALEFIARARPDVKIEVIDQYNTGPYEVKDLELDTVRTFYSIKELVAKTGFVKTTVLDALKDPGRKVIYDRYVIREKTDDDWPEDVKYAMYKPMPVEITDTVTNVTESFKSLKAAARKFGICKGTFKRMALRPKEGDRFIVKRTSPPFLEQSGMKQESELLGIPKALKPTG